MLILASVILTWFPGSAEYVNSTIITGEKGAINVILTGWATLV